MIAKRPIQFFYRILTRYISQFAWPTPTPVNRLVRVQLNQWRDSRRHVPQYRRLYLVTSVQYDLQF